MQESNLLEKVLSVGRKLIPRKIFRALQPAYHYSLALLGALIYRFPSKQIAVIAVTGTKGKTTTTEFIETIFRKAGYKTALANTIHFKIGDKEWPNKFKMTMRGRFFTQRLLRQAVNAGCTYAILEMSSESVMQYREKFIDLDALVFTNLAPEHIESHGSYDNYVSAKLKIAKILEVTSKKNPAIIVNTSDKEADKFLSLNIKNKIHYSISESNDFNINLKVAGEFNVLNAIGAIKCAEHFGISRQVAKEALESIDKVRGRMEKIEEGQNFEVIVDYAHTPDSLRAVYKTYADSRTICILGNTGGGRDKWKRAEMAKIADEYCKQIILTNEDPYDEDPRAIVDEMVIAIENKDKVRTIMDRRTAISTALSEAKQGSVVIITGKGTDPYIMGPNGTKQPWDDATVVREELKKIL